MGILAKIICINANHICKYSHDAKQIFAQKFANIHKNVNICEDDLLFLQIICEYLRRLFALMQINFHNIHIHIRTHIGEGVGGLIRGFTIYVGRLVGEPNLLWTMSGESGESQNCYGPQKKVVRQPKNQCHNGKSDRPLKKSTCLPEISPTARNICWTAVKSTRTSKKPPGRQKNLLDLWRKKLCHVH